MSRLIVVFVLAGALVACSQPAQAPPTTNQAPTTVSAPRPVAVIATPTAPAPTTAPAATSTAVAAPTAPATTTAPAATSTAETANPVPSDPTALPVALREVVWQGIRFQYDSNQFRFSETVPNVADPQPRATASVSYITNPCIGVSDCLETPVHLELYSRGGLDFWTWLSQYAGPPDLLEGTIAGQPAASWYTYGLGYGSVAVPVGEDVLLMDEWEGGVLEMIGLEHPDGEALAIGRVAMTTPDRTWALWNASVGGVRVAERPLLYGGAFVTILDILPGAVRVRTAEDVTGWIHADAAKALTTKLANLGDRARMMSGRRLRITPGHALPVRESPRSSAGQIGELLTAGQEVSGDIVRGDWLRLGPNERWIRWYYDGTQYIDVDDQ